MPNNEFTSFIIAGTVVFALLILVIILFLFQIQKRNQNFKFEKTKLEHQFQETLLQAQLEIQEQTLKNISQEIHDNVGQVLSLAKLNLNTMDIARTEQLQGKIDNTLSQVSKAINDLRDISKSFNTDNIAAIGLLRAIEYELEMINKTGSYKAIFEINGHSKRFEAQRELILFRIVQEVLHNVIKHADAKTIKILAAFSDAALELSIRDDGKGFDLSALNQPEETAVGLGIRNMHNRARLIGAGFSMNSITGGGTSVIIVLPFENNNLLHKT